VLTRWQERAITAGLTVACLYAAIQVCECCGAAYADEGPLVAAVRQLQPALGAESVAGYAATIREAGARTDLDPLLLLAVAYRESSLHPDVARCRRTGARGEQGVMQVMPGSARALGYDPSKLHDCEYGLAAGSAHMKLCIQHGVRTTQEMARCHVAGIGVSNNAFDRDRNRASWGSRCIGH
jgi:membrane-bound lytic murein transglycosylase MltF